MTIVFRYDDCSAVSSLELERRLAGVFAAHGAQITIGVIPRVCAGSFHDAGEQQLLPLPSDKVMFLREASAAGSIEIALHGCTHQAARAGAQSEFMGVSRHEQVRRVKDGKRELEETLGCDVSTFIPPWNSYDTTTIDVLENAGFDSLSGSLRGPFPTASTLQFAPYSVWLPCLLPTVRAVTSLRWLTSTFVVMLHDFDFCESGKPQAWLTIDDLDVLLRNLQRRGDVDLYSVRQATAGGRTLTARALGPYSTWRRSVQRFPWRYRQLLENQALWTPATAAGTAFTVHLYQAILSTFVLAIDFVGVVRRRLVASRGATRSAAGMTTGAGRLKP